MNDTATTTPKACGLAISNAVEGEEAILLGTKGLKEDETERAAYLKPAVASKHTGAAGLGHCMRHATNAVAASGSDYSWRWCAGA